MKGRQKKSGTQHELQKETPNAIVDMYLSTTVWHGLILLKKWERKARDNSK
ncbi:hypothetical protein DPMN_030490 [Dreissena polymorpha]|uniref:Uncharacterized protein n=1 Tax=Dreissena polymorpha TaxID=45954 RepID=A0A9D4M0H1_DREPO|nr:hypothetical protein DPMN_030490 [Dreissena polymorpha]